MNGLIDKERERCTLHVVFNVSDHCKILCSIRTLKTKFYEGNFFLSGLVSVNVAGWKNQQYHQNQILNHDERSWTRLPHWKTIHMKHTQLRHWKKDKQI